MSLPSGLHAKDLEECDAMEATHAGHQMPKTMMAGHDDCPMEHQHKSSKAAPSAAEAGMHDFGFACACSIEEAPVKTESPVYQKVKVKALAVVHLITENYTTRSEFEKHSILLSDSYSPPPIFLANETFLK